MLARVASLESLLPIDINSQPASYAQITSEQSSQLSPSNLPKQPLNDHERRYNLVFLGISEVEKGTNRHDRMKKDHMQVLSILTEVNPDIDSRCIRDCFRLGKYTDSKHRPILVKLTSANDVANILANRQALASLKVNIQPDLPLLDRKIRSILLKERRTLIVEGVERKDIKIKGKTLTLYGKKYGSTEGDSFIYDGDKFEKSHITAVSSPNTTQPMAQ